MVHRLTAKLSRFCGYLSAAFLAGIAIATLVQIVARQLGHAIETTELSGFFLAASTFLGLAYTLVSGGHVRVSIVSQFLPTRFKAMSELWVCLVGILITGFMTFQMARFAYDTFSYGDLSPGLLAVPLWIPQTAVAFGLLVILLALLDQAILVLRGQDPDYDTNLDSIVE